MHIKNSILSYLLCIDFSWFVFETVKSVFVCFIPLQTQRKVDVATLKDEIVKLKSQIVESPEELKNEMERMKENVKSIRMSKVCIISKHLR